MDAKAGVLLGWFGGVAGERYRGCCDAQRMASKAAMKGGRP